VQDQAVQQDGTLLEELQGDRATDAMAEEDTRMGLLMDQVGQDGGVVAEGAQRGIGRDAGEAGQGDRQQPDVRRHQRHDAREAVGAAAVAMNGDDGDGRGARGGWLIDGRHVLGDGTGPTARAQGRRRTMHETGGSAIVGREGRCSMGARTDDMAQDSGTALPGRPANGASRRTPTGGPTTADGARYLEELRAQWRARQKDGPRIFNPDETTEERDERVREALAGLAALAAGSDGGSDEPPEIWDEVMESIKRPRLEFREVDLDNLDS